MNFSIVIPTIPKHHKYLPKLIKLLEKDSKCIYEILIITSSTSLKDKIKIEKKITKFSKINKIRIIFTQKRQSAGQNRNTGWNLASGEYIMFMDADDYYLKNRTRILENVITEMDADIIIHNYYSVVPHFLLKSRRVSNSEEWIHTQQLRKSTWNGTERDTTKELGIRGDTNIKAIDANGKSWPIQHGHVTIRRDISLRFSTEYGEDGRLLRDALEANLSVIYLPDKLSIYNQFTLSFIARSMYRKLKGKLNLLF